ncbi:hypothetical protein DIE22_30230 [Burkholderia sp. Bp9142]|nr:hypothetical protein DIE22_30230 [Burkholderia sp. Bp9142]
MLPARVTARIDLRIGRGAYFVPAVGSVIANGVRIEACEGAALRNEPTIEVEALCDAEPVLVVAEITS